ncbi:peptidoglycan editing factor PgeF [Synechococcus sp. MIT S1220]|uniref:peptidoglycan editing factor PgeF n=1 Tax=Synechococcus sp. MIT S1220 TaxID=3082549 RepID=UPI0039AF0895
MSLIDPFKRPDKDFNALEGWTWVGCYGGYYLQANLLSDQGFEHGFFTRLWQGRGPDELAGYISAGISVHRPQQIHSSIVLEASEASSEPWPDGDGLVSDRGGQSLWVCGADCTPVLIADPATGHAAACHAGWRGVAARILPEAIQKLEARGASRNGLLAALGPAVSGSNYQVGQEVVKAIGKSLQTQGSDQDLTLERLKTCGALRHDDEPGKYRLDIRSAAVEQLVGEGLEPAGIAHCPLCTIEEEHLFHSWRRDQVKAVQWSGIVGQAATQSTQRPG